LKYEYRGERDEIRGRINKGGGRQDEDRWRKKA
jgi:hypothetical protein